MHIDRPFEGHSEHYHQRVIAHRKHDSDEYQLIHGLTRVTFSISDGYRDTCEEGKDEHDDLKSSAAAEERDEVAQARHRATEHAHEQVSPALVEAQSASHSRIFDVEMKYFGILTNNCYSYIFNS
jgi:hypothetical protein